MTTASRISAVSSVWYARGFEMVLVSSGAVAVGTAKLGLAERPKELSVKQAAAAVGQCELMHIYDKMFLEYGINVAQILLTRENIVDDDQRANIHNTFTALTRSALCPSSTKTPRLHPPS